MWMSIVQRCADSYVLFFCLWDLHRLLQYPPIQCNGLPLVTQYKQKQTWDLQTTTSSVVVLRNGWDLQIYPPSTPGKLFTRMTLPTFVSQLINCNLCNHISPPTDNLKVHMYENSTSSRRRVVHEMISTCISYHSMNHHWAQSVFFKIWFSKG